MAPNEQLKPFILNEKSRIRSTVVKYFNDSRSQDTDLLPLVLDACDRYGDQECLLELAYSNHFSVSDSSVVRIWEKIKVTSEINLFGKLNDLLGSCPLRYFQEHKSDIMSMNKADLNTLVRLQRRDFYSQRSPEELWEKLKRFSEAWNGHEAKEIPKSLQEELEPFENDNFFTFTSDILDELSTATVPEPSEVLRLLYDPQTPQSYLEVMLVELIGRRKIMEGVPFLINTLESEDFDLPENAIEAMQRMQDAAIVPRLLERYFTGKEYAPNYILGLLGGLKVPESEDTLLEILKTETDVEKRSRACISLCDLVSEKGLPTVIQQIIAGYDDSFSDLIEDSEIAAEILGIEIPQTDEWLRAKKHYEDRKQKRKQFGWSLFPGHKPNAPLLPSAGLMQQKSEDKQKPVLPVANKVGRNDPCPCGSGKKYKKCCGKNA